MLKIKFLIIPLAFLTTSMGFAQTTNPEQAKVIKLDEAIQLGIQNNRQLKIAKTDVAIANENVSQAKMAKTPRLGLNSGYSYIGNYH